MESVIVAGLALAGQVAVDLVAAGASLVGELQLRPGGSKFADHTKLRSNR
jgi:hypothetical protein